MTEMLGLEFDTATEPVLEKKPDAVQDIMAAMSGVLLPTETEEPVEPESKPEPEPVKAEPKPAVPVHSPQLMRLAASWGIGPDEATRYTTEDALLGAVALREVRWRNANDQRTAEPREVAQDKTEPVMPKIELNEEIDPGVRTAITGLAEYAANLKKWADTRLAAYNDEIVQLRGEHQRNAESMRSTVEEQNARLIDEKVASWGEEFKELLGVPTQTWRQSGTAQHAELTKLHGKARQLAAGFAALNGRDPTVVELGDILEEARHAVWPERIKNAALAEIGRKARKQRSGVALRPIKSHQEEEPPEQGDDAAKAAIGTFMTDHGLDPWARRKVS